MPTEQEGVVITGGKKTMSTTTDQSKAKLLHELGKLPQERLAQLIIGILDTVQAKRDRAFINMIKTSASKDKAED